MGEGSQPDKAKSLIVVMGISGCGKSTIGRELARRNSWPFLEGDEFHPAANIAKMSGGQPLTDNDRSAWVDAMAGHVSKMTEDIVVLACSALTEFVRAKLSECGRALIYVHLNTDGVDMQKRLQARRGHFMPPDLLDSQRAALTVPGNAAEFDASQSPAYLVNSIHDYVSRLFADCQA